MEALISQLMEAWANHTLYGSFDKPTMRDTLYGSFDKPTMQGITHEGHTVWKH